MDPPPISVHQSVAPNQDDFDEGVTSDSGESSSQGTPSPARPRALSRGSRVTCLKPQPAPLTAEEKEEKRLKHRQYVKKSYQKKIRMIESLKTELENLESQYHTLLEENQVLTPELAAVLMQAGGGDLESPLMRSYLQLTEVKSRIQCENETLYRINADYMKTEGRVQQLLDTDLQLPEYVPRFYIKPISESEYLRIVIESRDDILKFVNDGDKLSTGASVLGWTDERKVSGQETKFALEKAFPRVPVDELMTRTWRLVTSEKEFPKLYSAYLNTKYYVVHRINADSFIYLRTVSVEGSEFIAKTVFILSRLTIDNGYMFVFRSFDKDLVEFRESEVNAVMQETRAILAQEPVRKEVWVDLYIWLMFTKDERTGGSHFQFGGSTQTSMWYKEIIFVALRFEKLVVGPPIMLQF